MLCTALIPVFSCVHDLRSTCVVLQICDGVSGDCLSPLHRAVSVSVSMLTLSPPMMFVPLPRRLLLLSRLLRSFPCYCSHSSQFASTCNTTCGRQSYARNKAEREAEVETDAHVWEHAEDEDEVEDEDDAKSVPCNLHSGYRHLNNSQKSSSRANHKHHPPITSVIRTMLSFGYRIYHPVPYNIDTYASISDLSLFPAVVGCMYCFRLGCMMYM